MKRRLLACILAIAMTMTLLPATALAADQADGGEVLAEADTPAPAEETEQPTEESEEVQPAKAELLKARIDALPAADEVAALMESDPDAVDAVYEEVRTLMEAVEALAEELDTGKLDALVELFMPEAEMLAGEECSGGADCTHEAAIGNKHYDTLTAVAEAVQPGETIQLLKDISLADDAQIRIVAKGTKDSPITLDFNGKTITGNNSNTDKPNKATAKSGILFLDGCYIDLVDTSTTGTKGGVVNNTTATSGMVSVLVVISYSAPGSDVTINDGLRFEAEKGASARGIYHYRGNNAEIHLTINDAYVSSGGYTVDYSKLSGTGEVTINGGTFISKRGNNLSPVYGSAYLYINGGTFHNWGSSDIDDVTDGHTISMAESDGKYIYTVISEENAPTDYVASMKTRSGKTVYLTAGSDLYAFSNIQSLDKRTIHVAKDAALNIPEKFAMGYKNSGETQGSMLTLELEDGVKLTGSVSLYSADVIVMGNGDASGFSCVPVNDKFEMTVNGENGMYSCRMKVDGGAATLEKTDGTKIGYATASGAITAAKGDPGSVVVLNENASSTSTTKFGASADITLDLNGYTYTFQGTSKDGFQLTNGAKLTIINSNESKTGTFIATGAKGKGKANSAILTNRPGGGTIVIGENVTVKGPIVLLGEGSEATIAGTVDAAGLQEFAISGNGAQSENTKITIKDTAVIKSDSNAPAIYHPQVGTLTVEGGTIEGGTGIEMRSGTLIVNGGAITATADAFSCNPNGSGNTTTGAAIAIAQHTTKNDISVTISGGTFKGIKALNESNPQVNDPAPQVELSVTGGEFSGDIAAQDVNNFISGGYYTDDPSEYVAEGKAAVSSTKSGYLFMIGTKEEGGITEKPATADPEVKLAATIPEAQKTEVETSASTVDASTAIENAARTEELTDSVKTEATAAATTMAEGGNEAFIYKQTYLEITPTAYTLEEDTTTLVMDITPKMQVIVSTAKTAEDIHLETGTDNNAQKIGEAKELHITTPSEITVTLPKAAFGNAEVFIKHKDTYFYQAKADENGTITFVSKHGFSPFAFSTRNDAVAEITNEDGQTVGYTSLQAAVDAAKDSDTIQIIKPSADGYNAVAQKTITVENKSGREIKVQFNEEVESIPADGRHTFVYVTPVPATGVSLDSTSLTLSLGGTAALIATVAPDNATDKTVTWTSSNEGVVKVDESGKLTAVGYGTTIITAKVGAFSAACTVEVPYPYIPVYPGPVVPVQPAAPVSELPFVDVDVKDAFYEVVKYVYDTGLMTGTDINVFAPYGDFTRAQVATILFRLEKEPETAFAPVFPDVAADQWFTQAVLWGNSEGILLGYSNGRFGPNNAVTMEQLLTILYRYAGIKGYDTKARADVVGFDCADYAAEAVSWAAAHGMVDATSAATLRSTAARWQVAQVLSVFCQTVVMR